MVGLSVSGITKKWMNFRKDFFGKGVSCYQSYRVWKLASSLRSVDTNAFVCLKFLFSANREFYPNKIFLTTV